MCWGRRLRRLLGSHRGCKSYGVHVGGGNAPRLGCSCNRIERLDAQPQEWVPEDEVVRGDEAVPTLRAIVLIEPRDHPPELLHAGHRREADVPEGSKRHAEIDGLLRKADEGLDVLVPHARLARLLPERDHTCYRQLGALFEPRDCGRHVDRIHEVGKLSWLTLAVKS